MSPPASRPRFDELPSPVGIEQEVLAYWAERNIFEQSLQKGRGRPRFVFFEGPPTANGTPHNGHVLTRVIKDLFPRYKTMRGFLVERKAGWDTHGLPVEIEVEKALGMRDGGTNSREAVLAYGLDNFARRCVESVFTYTEAWEDLTRRVGFWVDLGQAYVTYHREYVESVWWALAELYRRGLLYQGKKIVWWWPEGGTALSNGEVGEGYRDVDDPSVTVRLELEDEPGTCLLAWTTTPWTLPSNVALAVGADLDYVLVEREEEGRTLRLIAAAGRAPEGRVLATLKGAELVGRRYLPLFPPGVGPGIDLSGASFVVVAGEHVSLETGTGIVHIAPAYGEADFQLRVEAGLGMIELVGPDGRFTPQAPAFLVGRYFKEADKDIIRDLRERGLLEHAGTIRHSYPFSPRSKDDPLMQLARPGWFIRTSAFKDQALANNQQVRWLPEHVQEGRFGDFLRNNVDWALSRERFWGTPLPIWQCPSCGAERAFGGVEELLQAGATGFDPEVDPHLQVHRPWIDRVKVPCTGCGGELQRVIEVIDCWFDSGCMPFAQFGFPHRGQQAFREAFPADFISEAVDQTRGWFYSLLMISTLLFDDETCARYGLGPVGYPRPYRNCVVLGHVCDMEGKKESKSVGNYTSPNLVLTGRMPLRFRLDPAMPRGQAGLSEAAVRSIDLAPDERMRLSADGQGGLPLKLRPWKAGKETVVLHPEDAREAGLQGESCWLVAPFEPPGADAFRWLFFASNPPWNNTRLSLRAIREGQREFHLRLANVFQFFTIYANISGFDAAGPAPARTALLDRWIQAKIGELVRTVSQQLDDYRIYEAARAITDFVDGLSNWYVRRSRARFWGEGEDARAALHTLFEVLCTLSRVIAPFTPFLAEAMYRRLEGGESVHLERWPEAGETDGELLADMELVRELCSLGLAARARVGVRVRQPLAAVELVLAHPQAETRLAPYLDLIRDELNVREVHFSSRAEDFVQFRVKPDFKALGARLGKEMKACAAVLAGADGAEVRRAVLSGEGFAVPLPSGEVRLGEGDVVLEVVPREGFQAAGSANAVVALRAELDDDLRQEGLAREVLNRLQVARKDADLDYTARIAVELRGAPALVAAVQRFHEHLGQEALVVDWSVQAVETALSDSLDGHAFELRIRPVVASGG